MVINMNTYVEISTEYIKLDSFLKLAGIAANGGEAKALICGGVVNVNGEVCTARGRKLRPGDTVSAGGTTVALRKKL